MPIHYGTPSNLLLLVALATTVHAMTRYIGDPSDRSTQDVSQSCGGFDQLNFTTGRCPRLMSCILDNIRADTAAGFQSGGTIIGLVPTILTLIAAPPLELVQLAILSPHRALATVCFGIGLPSGLFRQLRATSTSLIDTKPNEPETREWTFRLLSKVSATKRPWWRGAKFTLVVDAIILGLAAGAIWFNHRVSSRVMITWRCEYGSLVCMW